MFQCSSASRKFLKVPTRRPPPRSPAVSVLFSEPKIPQRGGRVVWGVVYDAFQCSSASRKFLKSWDGSLVGDLLEFQCSSASRKFLNVPPTRRSQGERRFQCSSASRKFLNQVAPWWTVRLACVSVLFSEPKIPQPRPTPVPSTTGIRFSALQRAENSSNAETCAHVKYAKSFSALQRAENSSTERDRSSSRFLSSRFSALQRAENSSTGSGSAVVDGTAGVRFSALQRAENSSTPTLAPASIHISDRDDHASSFLSLPGASP